MEINFDPDKNAKSILERSLSFERAAEFDFETAQFTIDNRCEYGETRYRALSSIACMSWFVEMISFKKPINLRLSTMKPNPESIDKEDGPKKILKTPCRFPPCLNRYKLHYKA